MSSERPGVGGGFTAGELRGGGLAAATGDLMILDTDDNTLVLDHIPADVGDLHGAGGSSSRLGHPVGFPNGDAFYDSPATPMTPNVPYGGQFTAAQHSALPTIGDDGQQQVYNAESNNEGTWV